MKKMQFGGFISIAFLLAIFIVAVSIFTSLYSSALKANQQNLSYIAKTTSKLISSVASFDRRYSDNDGLESAAKATLGQVTEALGGGAGLGDTGEIILIMPEGENIRVLVHQITQDPEHEHPDVIAPGSAYFSSFSQAIAGGAGSFETLDRFDHRIYMAYAHVEGTEWTIIVVKQLYEIRAPFIQAGFLGSAITIIVAVLFGSLIYRAAMRISHEAREAKVAAEAALAESQDSRRQLDAALDVMNEGFALFDREDRLVTCNGVYKDFYNTHAFAIVPGSTFEEILRAGVKAGAFPQANGREDAWIRERLAQHQATETVQQQLDDGRWLKITETRTLDGGIVGVRTDITEIIEREKSLRESEQRYKDFTETASDWTWETDAEHRFCISNRGNRGKEVFDESLIKMKRRQEVAAEDTTTDKWHHHQRALDAHLPFDDFQYWTIAPNNNKRLIAVSGIPVFDNHGTFTGYRGTGRDITDEYRSARKIEAAEERFRLAFESVTMGIILSDRKGRITAFNQAAEKMFGYTREEVLGKNVSMLASDHDRQHHDLYIENYQETRQAKIIGIGREVKGQRKDGETFPLNLGIAEMNIDGEVQYIASMLDLTAEKLLEQKLQQAQKMEAVGQLVGGIAHDFNNLLGIIIGNLDLMRRKIEPETRLAKQVGKAFNAAERGANLTRRLLNFSRQMPTDAHAVDVNETIIDLHDLIQKALTERVSVEMKLDPEIPLATAEKGDLEDVITNLCINARDAMPDGGRIIIETRFANVASGQRSDLRDLKPGHYVEIDVSDTGTGMSPEVIARIFEPFFSTKEKGKGTGLGLAMVYGFTKRSGGMITVYSEQGLGTTFKLFLPASEEEFAVVEELDDDDADYSGHEKILIVDDEEDLAEIAQSILSDFGYQTLVAHNGQDALDIILKDDSIDMLLSDVIMPGELDGYHLALRAQEARPTLKVCLASGFTGAAMANKHADFPDYALLKKPYTNAELARTVRQILDQA